MREVLDGTKNINDNLASQKKLQALGWKGGVVPAFDNDCKLQEGGDFCIDNPNHFQSNCWCERRTR